jgi:peptidoglycan/LPS O-acetylase OafA/YrhL
LPYLGSIILTIILFKLSTIINPELFLSTNPRQYNQAIITASNEFSIRNLFWSLIFIANPQYIGYNYPYWSLLIEAMFYIVAPFFIKRPKTF